MAEVRIQNLVKRFNVDSLAVDNLNLVIRDGEFLVLLGPSGCGKTTTLRCVAGLEAQTSGDIYIGEHLVNGLPAGERDIAFVFQFYALYPHLSAYDNIAFPLRAQQVKPAEVDEQVRRAAKMLRIEYLLKRTPKALSSGEQQRVALGRAMVRRPQVFLMDEPLTNLDAQLRADMRAELKHLQEELSTTMIYVTHDQVEAMSMGHRIAVMNKGVLQQVGTPLEIYDRPATLFVADFIGSPPINLIPCTYAGGAEPALVSDALQARVPLNGGQHLLLQPASQSLVMGVRPEDVHITADSNGSSLHGEIAVVEPLGDEIIYIVQIGDQQVRVRTEPTLRLREHTPVGVKFDMARLHVFDASSQARLKNKE